MSLVSASFFNHVDEVHDVLRYPAQWRTVVLPLVGDMPDLFWSINNVEKLIFTVQDVIAAVGVFIYSHVIKKELVKFLMGLCSA
jgi:hypothetical protein